MFFVVQALRVVQTSVFFCLGECAVWRLHALGCTGLMCCEDFSYLTGVCVAWCICFRTNVKEWLARFEFTRTVSETGDMNHSNYHVRLSTLCNAEALPCAPVS